MRYTELKGASDDVRSVQCCGGWVAVRRRERAARVVRGQRKGSALEQKGEALEYVALEGLLRCCKGVVGISWHPEEPLEMGWDEKTSEQGGGEELERAREREKQYKNA